MNKRIKELAEQARKYAWENETHWSAIAEREALFEEKFAELIVKECAKSLWTEECHTSDLASEEYTRGSNKIKKHFGVEE
jgi:hypothetical protein